MTEEKAVVQANNLPAVPDGLGDGFEEATADSYTIPRLRILHQLSPQCNPTDGKYIDGAQQGKVFNTVTEAIADVIQVIPVHYRKTYVEWKPIDQGGGFVEEHAIKPDNLETREGKAPILPNGNEIAETHSHWVLQLMEDGSTSPAIISMTSVQRKKSRNWMTVMAAKKDAQRKQSPMWSHIYTMSTVAESNDKGSWAGWKVDGGVPLTDSGLFTEAMDFRKAVTQGLVTVAEEEDSIPYE